MSHPIDTMPKIIEAKNGWRKFFLDGSSELGLDDDKTASWRNGRLVGICGVYLVHNGKAIYVRAPHNGRFWQSDSYECDCQTGKNQLVARRIGKQLTEDDTLITLSPRKDGVMALVQAFGIKGPKYVTLDVPPNSVGQWFVLELNTRNGEIRHFFSPKQP